MQCKCGKIFIPSGQGMASVMCASCRSNRRRYQLKKMYIDYLGGRCKVCGYDKCPASLHFHHRDPEIKNFRISGNHCRKWEVVQNELDKCDLLCGNCHAELHFQESSYRNQLNRNEGKIKYKDSSIRNVCLECGKIFQSKKTNSKYCSRKCHNKSQQKIVWPPVMELINRVKNNSYRSVASELEVSDNAIRKYFRSHKIDPKKVRSISDNGK